MILVYFLCLRWETKVYRENFRLNLLVFSMILNGKEKKQLVLAFVDSKYVFYLNAE